MRDYDVGRRARLARDREFRIGGETFVRRATVRPEEWAEWEDLTPGIDLVEFMAVLDRTVCALIEPDDDAAGRWMALRERGDDAITFEDARDVIAWLVGEQAGRPTDLPLVSTVPPVAIGTSSTDDSSSQEG